MWHGLSTLSWFSIAARNLTYGEKKIGDLGVSFHYHCRSLELSSKYGILKGFGSIRTIDGKTPWCGHQSLFIIKFVMKTRSYFHHRIKMMYLN